MLQHSPLPEPKPLRAGLIGFGVVGAGTHVVLRSNGEMIRARAVAEDGVELLRDPLQLARHPGLDVVIEAMGGTTDARRAVLEAIAHGKHVVTANKALLAMHGEEIFSAARAKGVSVGFEAAVAVSIPIVKALREGLVANRIEWLAGIVNGTSNYVLTRMGAVGRSFAQALAEAQAWGYAEADPALDVGGEDAAHKLALLAAMASGGPPRLDAMHVEGITGVQPQDFLHARRLGYAVKLLAVAQPLDDGALQLRVHPALVPRQSLLAQVDGRMNGIMVKGDAAGVPLYCGAGAGACETAARHAGTADRRSGRIARRRGRGCAASGGRRRRPRDTAACGAAGVNWIGGPGATARRTRQPSFGHRWWVATRSKAWLECSCACLRSLGAFRGLGLATMTFSPPTWGTRAGRH